MSARWQDRQPHTLLLPETINSVTHGPVPFKRNPETSEEAPKPGASRAAAAKREGNAMAVIHLGPAPWPSLVRLNKVLSRWHLPKERRGARDIRPACRPPGGLPDWLLFVLSESQCSQEMAPGWVLSRTKARVWTGPHSPTMAPAPGPAWNEQETTPNSWLFK